MTTSAADLVRGQIRDLEHTIAEAERAAQQGTEALDQALMAIDATYTRQLAAIKAERKQATAEARIAHGSPAGIAELRAQHKRLTKALALLDPTTAGPECPECGRRFQDATGLGAHRFHVHGVAGATTTKPKAAIAAVPTTTKPKAAIAAVPAPTPEPPKPATGPHLECEACGTAFPADQAAKLVAHVEGVHGRRPTKGERTPKQAAA